MQVGLTCLLAIFIVASSLSGCRFMSDDQSVVIDGDYPIAYVKRPKASLGTAIDSKINIIGSDLYLRELPSPNAKEINITQVLTNGQGMVADPDVSFDGNRVVFALQCTAESSERCNTDTTWNIWIYDHEQGTLNRAINDFEVANQGDDLDPAFLPDGKIVFSSTRQKTTSQNTGFQYATEDQRTTASVLHTLDLGSQVIEQISFNRSHDRNPSVLQNGKIVFSRWDHVGDRNQISIYTANPDGTGLDVYYGAHSPGEAFLHPKELPSGKLLSTVLPLVGTWEGGALMEIDVQNYSDADAPAPGVLDKSISGQQPATMHDIPLNDDISRQGRFTTPYPLYDDSNQVLVSFSFFQQTAGEINQAEEDTPVEETTPSYGVYMLDLNDRSLKPLVLPPGDTVVTDPVALYPRTTPPVIPRQITNSPGVFDPNNNEGIINVKSVYDTDKYGRMGQGVLTPQENAVTPIPLINNPDLLQDTRDYLPDIAQMKDPVQTTADQRPARFVRVMRSIPTPTGVTQQLIGETPFEMQRIVGYSTVEPDGSFRIKVPADVPLTVSVLDKYGRAFENHTNWLQVRPGETLTCNGCHSPDRNPALNSTPIAGSHPNTSLRTINGTDLGNVIANPGETMAETRTRDGVDSAALELRADIIYQDVWTNPAMRSLDPSINYSYANLQVSPAPQNGIINYPEHIQPILDSACVNCHNGIRNTANNPTGLNLNGFEGGSGRLVSYENLMKGKNVLDEDGLPYFEFEGDILNLRKGLPLVNAGYARGSHLIEVLFNEELFAEKPLAVNATDHTAMLNDAQRRLVVEWVDIGAQYFNDPYDENGEIIDLKDRLDFNYYAFQLHDDFISQCASCHSPVTIGGQVNNGFMETSLVLLRNTRSDYASVVNMVGSSDAPANSFILSFPSDPTGVHDRNADNANLPPEAYMPQGGDFYNKVFNWIQGATE